MLRNQAVTAENKKNRAATEWLPHDFKENEAAERLLGASICYVTTAYLK